MEKKRRINIKWIIVGVLIFCFVLIASLMITDRIHGYDNFVYGIISRFISPTMTKIVTVITNMADPITIVIMAFVISCFIGIVKKDKKTAILFCLNLVVIAAFNFLLKNIFTRTRPENIGIISESGYSFPSGHSSIAVAFYGYIIYLVNKSNISKTIKVICSALLSILILLIGISRIYLGVHYASDVTAAFIMALSILIIYIHVTKVLIQKGKEG